MALITDNQTLNDLKILGRPGQESVLQLFDRTNTRGGALLLEELFRYPLSDAAAIRDRRDIIQHISETGTGFPFNSELFDQAELYISNTDERTRLSGDERTLSSRLNQLMGVDTEYGNIYKGVGAVIRIMQILRDLIIAQQAGGRWLGVFAAEVMAIFEDTSLSVLLDERVTDKISYDKIADYDALLRFRIPNTVRKVLGLVYRLDVYMAVAKVAAERGFVFPEILDSREPVLSVEDAWHPFLKKPVANSFQMRSGSNVLFLTGANMAGKSTFMKTVSLSLFLAHMGFPVPARKMSFTVLDGIFTTINLPDDLGMGASHFYAEVLRVKKMATELRKGKRLFILFDELFRGTNVKDAYEATIAITSAFARRKESLFVISTHIIEAGEVLKGLHTNIIFRYLPTLMDGNKPVYTYTLETGITADRHGMVIVRNEGILDILKKRKTNHA